MTEKEARRHELTDRYAYAIVELVDRCVGFEPHIRSALIYPFLQKFADEFAKVPEGTAPGGPGRALGRRVRAKSAGKLRRA